mgnify:CR=1 FL=1
MRIRTVKPEFWTHPVMGRQSPEIQLLALGLLNLADDDGYFLADSELIRSALTPFSDSSRIVHGSITTLVSVGWIEVRTHETHGPIGKVVNFAKHQVINRPKPSKLVEYFENSAITDESLTNHGRVTDRSLLEGKGMEQGMEQGMEHRPHAVDRLREIWNTQKAPEQPEWKKPKGKDAREKPANARWPEHSEEEWVAIVQRVAASAFCKGANDRGWRATPDWLLRPGTSIKILEGAYDNRATPNTRAPVASESVDWTKVQTGEIDL